MATQSLKDITRRVEDIATQLDELADLTAVIMSDESVQKPASGALYALSRMIRSNAVEAEQVTAALSTMARTDEVQS